MEMEGEDRSNDFAVCPCHPTKKRREARYNA
jgi:hypothetical protein